METIRDAQDGDLAALTVLLDELGYPVEAAELAGRLRAFVEKGNGRVLVLDVDGKVVAFAALEVTFPLHHRTSVCHLSSFAVATAARRRGVGRRLLLAVEQAARDSGCALLVLTSANHRSDAHAFYPAAGYQLTGRKFTKVLGS